MSFDPITEVDWDTPLDTALHGAGPEWSTLFGTAYWSELTEAQQRELTRQESASVANTGIWFEMILQQMVLREAAYAAILVAEEVLDVMQRDWMRDERVAPFVRTITNIHVVEESRHMRFARDEVCQRMQGSGRLRRHRNAFVIATAAYFIVTSMVGPEVSVAAGLDRERAVRETKGNEHHRAMMRSSCGGLMEFLGSARQAC
jgi:hypothetical protein